MVLKLRNTLSLLALVASLVVVGCGPTSYVLAGRQPFLGADAVVEVEDADGSYVVSVELTNLFPANRVSPELTHYVLWLAPIGGAPVRAATVQYDASDREGNARATFADPRFTVSVTAEGSETPSVPSANVVFEQVVDAN